MNKKELIQRLQDIEWEDFEVKNAAGGLPKNIWETVSACLLVLLKSNVLWKLYDFKKGAINSDTMLVQC